MEAWSPAWITRPFGANALLDREAREVNETELKIYGRAHPSLLDSGTPYVGCNEEGTGWFDMIGHFDDPVSSDCRISRYDMATDETRQEEPALSIADCRQTFVYTELRPARGP